MATAPKDGSAIWAIGRVDGQWTRPVEIAWNVWIDAWANHPGPDRLAPLKAVVHSPELWMVFPDPPAQDQRICGDAMTCDECDGRGEVLDAPGRVLDGRASWEPCPKCHGTGTVREQPMTCPNCGGECERDEVDNGVGLEPCGPWGCPECQWVESEPTDVDEFDMRRVHRLIDQPIRDLATHPAPFLTVNVLAEYLDVERDTIVRMIRGGSLYGFKVGREWRIPTEAARLAFPLRRSHSA